MITIQEEWWDEFFPDFLPIWETEHGPEVHPPEMPNRRLNQAVYQRLENADALTVMTARDNGQLVGYLVSVTAPFPHADLLCAHITLYYVRKPWRRQGIFGRVMTKARQCWEADGVALVSTQAKVALGFGPALEATGFHLHELGYLLWLPTAQEP
jgi:GNAT superfamily N-acetyltransferase